MKKIMGIFVLVVFLIPNVAFLQAATTTPLQNAAQHVSSSVVTVFIAQYISDNHYLVKGLGSGFIFTANGYILTNNHVVSDQGLNYIVELLDGTKKLATVVYRDPVEDVAIIKIEGTYPNFAFFGVSSNLKVEQKVASIGNSYGVEQNSIAEGIITGFNKHILAHDGDDIEDLHGLIEMSTPITPGFSGGPLLNAAGSIIGMTVAKDTDSTNQSYAIPIGTIQQSVRTFFNSLYQHL